MSPSNIKAIGLYSGGLDSTLACRVIMAQGIKVIAVKFISPFFGYDLLSRQEEHINEIKSKFDIDLRLEDITEDYLQMLGNPSHGYGKNFNPCIDCKILILSKARGLMEELGASFLLTGEVVGQRPMSQRRDTLRVIERDSGCEDILLRPLCAKLLNPTKPELEGLIDREQLLDFSGRTRIPQMQLAEQFGIKDYPSPAGGCTLTDPILGSRIERYFKENKTINAEDIRFMLVGRQFRLPHGGWLAVGRNELENKRVSGLQQPGDYLIKLQDRPGPTAILRYADHPDDLLSAAGIVVRYGKKIPDESVETTVNLEQNKQITSLVTGPLDDTIYQPWKS